MSRLWSRPRFSTALRLAGAGETGLARTADALRRSIVAAKVGRAKRDDDVILLLGTEMLEDLNGTLLG